MKNQLISILTCIFISPFIFAAIPIQQAASEKLNRYIEKGVFVGGYDNGVQVLNSLRSNYNKDSKIERVVLDLSSFHKNLAAKRPGFFHISVQKNKKRILISLENIIENKLNDEKLSKVLNKSEFIESGRIFFDDTNKNLTLELKLAKLAQVEVFELSRVKKNGRIVLDLK
ncbi:MAG: hypothetical protein IPM57_09170 [Oligoflexia bacterium]|nr:hypothetical protein [Oligoflexia bacterium]